MARGEVVGGALGERFFCIIILSYGNRLLDVEYMLSVYSTMMGLKLWERIGNCI